MSGPEILPGTTDGLDYSEVETTPVGGRVSIVGTYTGPTTLLVAKKAELLATAPAMSGLSGCVLTKNANGRGTLVASYERSSLGNNLPGIEDSIQQLNAIKVTRDIFSAPYFAALTNAEVVKVRNAYEKCMSVEDYDVAAKVAGFTGANGDLMKSLFGHLTHGQDSYTALAYEFTKSWKTTSGKRLRVSCKTSNTVQFDSDLGFNSTTKALVTDIETESGAKLEWLKEPVELIYLGRGFWSITEKWIGLAKWSVIYGGSFTGVDA